MDTETPQKPAKVNAMNGTPKADKSKDQKAKSSVSDSSMTTSDPSTPGESAKKKKNKNKNKENAAENGSPAKKDGAQKQPKTPKSEPEKKKQQQSPGGKTPKRTLKGGIVVEDLKVRKKWVHLVKFVFLSEFCVRLETVRRLSRGKWSACTTKESSRPTTKPSTPAPRGLRSSSNLAKARSLRVGMWASKA